MNSYICSKHWWSRPLEFPFDHLGTPKTRGFNLTHRSYCKRGEGLFFLLHLIISSLLHSSLSEREGILIYQDRGVLTKKGKNYSHVRIPRVELVKPHVHDRWHSPSLKVQVIMLGMSKFKSNNEVQCRGHGESGWRTTFHRPAKYVRFYDF